MKIFIALILFMPVMSFAAEWSYIGNNSEMVFELDKTSIVTLKDGRKKAWTQFTMSTQQKYPKTGKPFSRLMMLHVYDCKNRTSALLQEVAYGGVKNQEVMGSISSPADLAIAEDVVPGSFDELALAHVCAAQAAAN